MEKNTTTKPNESKESSLPSSKIEFLIRFYSDVIVKGRINPVERRVYQAKLDALIDLYYEKRS